MGVKAATTRPANALRSLLFAKVVEGNDVVGIGVGGLAVGGLDLVGRIAAFHQGTAAGVDIIIVVGIVGGLGPELKAELDAGIDKGGHGGKGNVERPGVPG